MEETKEVKKKELHDLKSGLTAIMGYIQLAQLKLAKFEVSEAKDINQMLDKSIESAKALEEQIRKLEGIEEPLMDL